MNTQEHLKTVYGEPCKDEQLTEYFFNEKVYLKDMKLKPSQIKELLTKAYDEVYISGSRDKYGSYIMIYCTIYDDIHDFEYKQNEYEAKFTDFINDNILTD